MAWHLGNTRCFPSLYCFSLELSMKWIGVIVPKGNLAFAAGLGELYTSWKSGIIIFSKKKIFRLAFLLKKYWKRKKKSSLFGFEIWKPNSIFCIFIIPYISMIWHNWTLARKKKFQCQKKSWPKKKSLYCRVSSFALLFSFLMFFFQYSLFCYAFFLVLYNFSSK